MADDHSTHKTRFIDEFSIVPPKSLEELIVRLRDVFDDDDVNVDYVKALMTSYENVRSDWKQFSNFDPHRYTRNLVDEGNGKYNLIVLCWGEGHGSSIHDHADSHCFMKVLDGTITESLFDWPKEKGMPLHPKRKSAYSENEVAYINDDIGLHRVENESHTDPCVTLHLYSPPFDECKTFDQKSGKQRKCRVTFWSKYGERTPLKVSECCAAEDN